MAQAQFITREKDLIYYKDAMRKSFIDSDSLLLPARP
jgi:hypothetical protein